MGKDRTPAADLIAATAQTWIDALELGRAWDEARDTPRFRAAFLILCRDAERWPQPKELIAAMPAHVVPQLTKQPLPSDPVHPRTKAMIDGLANELGWGRKK
jgi:hypothetical protein